MTNHAGQQEPQLVFKPRLLSFCLSALGVLVVSSFPFALAIFFPIPVPTSNRTTRPSVA